MQDQCIINLVNLTKQFEDHTVLDKINLSIKDITPAPEVSTGEKAEDGDIKVNAESGDVKKSAKREKKAKDVTADANELHEWKTDKSESGATLGDLFKDFDFGIEDKK